MYQKQSDNKPKEKKSVVVVPSTRFKPDESVIAEETEIVAQITVPSGGGTWAWVILFASFFNTFVLDGVAFTYGSILSDIADSLSVHDSVAAFINSVQVAFYYISSPLASALINRYGFRTVGMLGAIICGFSAFAAYFANDVISLVIFYGCCNGLGCSLISMTSSLIVGFYFEKIRAVALAIVQTGSSAGIMILYPVNSILVELSGWKPIVLLYAGLFGLCYFTSLTFRPLLSVIVTKIDEQGEPPPVVVTYLPSTTGARRVSDDRRRSSGRKHSGQPQQTTATKAQMVFGTVSNTFFPTAANVVREEGEAIQPQAMTSRAPTSSSAPATSKLVITTQTGISQRQLQQVKSVISRRNVKDENTKANIEIDIAVEEVEKKPTCCGQICSWESDAPESRPMYKDDVFYNGQVQKLPVYQKSRADVPVEDRTGLEYQMAVSRAVTVADMQEKRGVFTTAVRRVLATMMDPKLLKKKSFLLLCLSGFLTYIGVLVPYVFIQDRNLKAGVDPSHCTYFVSVLAFSNLLGKLILSALSMKVDCLAIYCLGLVSAGVSTIVSGLSYALMYQYIYVCVFGFSVAVITCLRSILIVSLYGLEALTNATGIAVLFVGVANLFGTPLAAFLKDSLGYDTAFYVSGAFLVMSGLVAVPMRRFSNKEQAVK